MEQTALIIGNLKTSNHIAQQLLRHHIKVVISTREKIPGIQKLNTSDQNTAEIIQDSQVIRCLGNYGDFLVTLKTGKGSESLITIPVSIIIIDAKPEIAPEFKLYGLIPGLKVIALSDIQKKVRDFAGRKIVFLAGIFKESNPVVHQRIMESVLLLQKDYGFQTYTLTGNLKVAQHGQEELYQRTRDAGAIYIKYTDTKPKITSNENGDVHIIFTDEIIGSEFKLTPDLVVVDEQIHASDYFHSLSEILKIESDMDYFLQKDNIHRNTVYTNRKGILVTGNSRGIMSDTEKGLDAHAAAITAIQLLEERLQTDGEKAQITQGQCVKCLTCYRLCPYSAISPEIPIRIFEQSCERCGICVANCPKKAITISDLNLLDQLDQLQINSDRNHTNKSNSEFKPEILIFFCSHSGSLALDRLSYEDNEHPNNIKSVNVPCGGSISDSHILDGFKYADGIMVFTCHQDNCHSHRGTSDAKNRCAKVSDRLQEVGFTPKRLQFHTIAANMGSQLKQLIREFNASLIKLGPNILKK